MTLSRDSEVVEQEAARWFARQIGGSWTSAHQKQLDAWLGKHAAHRIAFMRIDATWKRCGRMFGLRKNVPPGTIPRRGSWSKAGFPKVRKLGAGARPELQGARNVEPEVASVSGDGGEAAAQWSGKSGSWLGIEGRAAPKGCVRGNGGLLRLKKKRSARGRSA
ncbi:MAG: FecR/PupR family sigma factor regulator [Gammaproteobacteria bacterium]